MRPFILSVVVALAATAPAAAGWFEPAAPSATAPADAPGEEANVPAGTSASAGAPATAPAESPVVGAWLCDLSDPSEPGMAGSRAELEYRADGTSSAYAELHYPAAEGPGILTATGKGRWHMENGRLIEAMTDYTILSLSEGAVMAAWSEVPADVRKLFEDGFESMRGVEITSTIERGPGGRLILTDESGAVSDCLPQ